MARVKELSYFLERKISDGDYGHFGFHVGEVTELERGDDYKEEMLAQRKRVRRLAQAHIDEFNSEIAKINAAKPKKER